MIELVEHRTLTGKLFEAGDGAYLARLSAVPVHVPVDPAAWMRGDSDALDDVDLSWDIDHDVWHVRRAWYDLTVWAGVVGYYYRDRTTGAELLVHLQQLGTTVLRVAPSPRIDGSRLWWDDVAPGVDVYLDVRPTGVEIFKRLRHADAPRSFTWRLQEALPQRIGFSTLTRGWEADGRRLQIVYDVGQEDLWMVPGSRVWRVTETWTGRTIDRDPVTRKARLSSAVSYPVLIDFDVSVAIAADADDGTEYDSGLWADHLGYTAHTIYNYTGATKEYPAYRLLSVAIPQGATITLATFTINIASVAGPAGGGAWLYGRAIDTAPAWATNAGPSEMTLTTARVAFAFGGSTPTGVTAYDVAAIVQEIVNRAGWVSGNHLAFGVQGALTGNHAKATITDRIGGATNVAKLDVNFTTGGAGVALPQLERGIRGVMRGLH